MTLRTLPQIRAEARRRGMAVVQQRRTMGRPPLYHVQADYWAGVNLQRQAGDTTPPAAWLDGLPALRAWAAERWGDTSGV